MRATLGVVSVVDAIAADIRDRVLRGDLAPGAPLGEVDTARHYDVARPTVKAAIESLVHSGLLERGPHRTARVTTPTAADVDDIYRTRALIEAGVVRRLAQTRTVPAAAVAANARIAALGEDEPLRVVDPDMHFHTALVEGLGSPRARHAYLRLADEVRLCMVRVQGATLLATADIAAEHAAILAEIAGGRAEAAVAGIEGHLDRARARLVAHLDAGAA